MNTNGRPDLMSLFLGFLIIKLVHFSLVFGIHLFSTFIFELLEK